MLSDDVTIPKRKCKAVALYLSCSAEEAGVLSVVLCLEAQRLFSVLFGADESLQHLQKSGLFDCQLLNLFTACFKGRANFISA